MSLSVGPEGTANRVRLGRAGCGHHRCSSWGLFEAIRGGVARELDLFAVSVQSAMVKVFRCQAPLNGRRTGRDRVQWTACDIGGLGWAGSAVPRRLSSDLRFRRCISWLDVRQVRKKERQQFGRAASQSVPWSLLYRWVQLRGQQPDCDRLRMLVSSSHRSRHVWTCTSPL